MRKRRYLIAIAAAGLLVVAAAAFGASRVFSGSSRSPGLPVVRAPLSVTLNRSGGRLHSVDVTVNPSFAGAHIQLEVLYLTGSQGAPSSEAVVYDRRVSATNRRAGGSTWSGTLSPGDWRGGCRRGIYWIYAASLGPRTSLADGGYRNSESDTSKRFRCG